MPTRSPPLIDRPKVPLRLDGDSADASLTSYAPGPGECDRADKDDRLPVPKPVWGRDGYRPPAEDARDVRPSVSKSSDRPVASSTSRGDSVS